MMREDACGSSGTNPKDSNESDAKSRFMPFSDVDLFKYLNLCNKLPSDSFAIIPIIRYF